MVNLTYSICRIPLPLGFNCLLLLWRCMFTLTSIKGLNWRWRGWRWSHGADSGDRWTLLRRKNSSLGLQCATSLIRLANGYKHRGIGWERGAELRGGRSGKAKSSWLAIAFSRRGFLGVIWPFQHWVHMEEEWSVAGPVSCRQVPNWFKALGTNLNHRTQNQVSIMIRE